MLKTAIVFSLGMIATAALAAPTSFTIDADHTYPSFEADHGGGMSIWRGKFNKSSGTIRLDRAARSGDIDITIDAASIDFGNDRMNEHAKKAGDMLDVAKYPTASYKGKFSKFNGDVPAEVDGELTLHGVTKPLKLTIASFMCKVNAVSKKETCGADASASFNRADFGVTFGQQMGVKMDVKLAIQVEAQAD